MPSDPLEYREEKLREARKKLYEAAKRYVADPAEKNQVKLDSAAVAYAEEEKAFDDAAKAWDELD